MCIRDSPAETFDDTPLHLLKAPCDARRHQPESRKPRPTASSNEYQDEAQRDAGYKKRYKHPSIPALFGVTRQRPSQRYCFTGDVRLGPRRCGPSLTSPVKQYLWLGRWRVTPNSAGMEGCLYRFL